MKKIYFTLEEHIESNFPVLVNYLETTILNDRTQFEIRHPYHLPLNWMTSPIARPSRVTAISMSSIFDTSFDINNFYQFSTISKLEVNSPESIELSALELLENLTDLSVYSLKVETIDFHGLKNLRKLSLEHPVVRYLANLARVIKKMACLESLQMRVMPGKNVPTNFSFVLPS